MQTADISEQITNKRNFTDPSNKVKVRRVPKQTQDLNHKIILCVEQQENISSDGRKKLWCAVPN